MGRKSKSGKSGASKPIIKKARVYVGRFANQDTADRARKKIALVGGLITVTHQDGVEVWTIQKPTIN
jgi:hypothetical protein